jgi:hypothetical protein
MAKNSDAPGVEKTQLIIPIYLVRKARFMQDGADVAMQELTGLEP